MNASLRSTLNKFAPPLPLVMPSPARQRRTASLHLRRASPIHSAPTLTRVLAARSTDAPRSMATRQCARRHLPPATQGSTAGSFLSPVSGEPVERRAVRGWAAAGASARYGNGQSSLSYIFGGDEAAVAPAKPAVAEQRAHMKELRCERSPSLVVLGLPVASVAGDDDTYFSWPAYLPRARPW